MSIFYTEKMYGFGNILVNLDYGYKIVRKEYKMSDDFHYELFDENMRPKSAPDEDLVVCRLYQGNKIIELDSVDLTFLFCGLVVRPIIRETMEESLELWGVGDDD